MDEKYIIILEGDSIQVRELAKSIFNLYLSTNNTNNLSFSGMFNKPKK